MRITIKQLKSLNACSDGIAWFKTQKNKEAKHILRQSVKEGQFSYANWFVTNLFTHPQCVQHSIFSAELCVKEFEKFFPSDSRPREAIEIVKKWLSDPTESNRSAAWMAAESARSAARTAAESAWSAAESAAESAAWMAAESARSAAESARSAAWSTARSAARTAARSAAESAAWSAAWMAAESAWSAARSAAESAAESARSAAWSAARSAAWTAIIENAISILGL
jgi:hypothetical protein